MVNVQIEAARIRSESRRLSIPFAPLVRRVVLNEVGTDSLRSKAAREAVHALDAEIARQSRLAAERRKAREVEPRVPALARYQAAAIRAMNTPCTRENDLVRAFYRMYRLGERFENRWRVAPELVHFGAPGTRPRSYTHRDREWGWYRGRFRNLPANVYTHHIAVAPGALSGRYAQLGILWVGGLLTLAARPCPAPNGVTAYQAVWLEQARGCAVRSARGYIVVRDGVAVHGETLRGAIRTLAARLRGTRGRTRLTDLSAEALYQRAEAAAKRRPDCIITLNDARASGYCEAGTRTFCYRAGVEDAWLNGQITASRLLEALCAYWDPLAAALLVRVAERRRKEAVA